MEIGDVEQTETESTPVEIVSPKKFDLSKKPEKSSLKLITKDKRSKSKP